MLKLRFMSVYNQLCVWHGTVMGENTVEELEEFFKENFDTRIKFEREVITNPDLDDLGNTVLGTGGRNDLLFYVHDDDIQKFAIPRFQLGVRWWEDVVYYNDGSHLYSKEILDTYPIKW